MLCALVAHQHHGVRPAPAERGEPVLGRRQKGPADAVAAPIGVDREPVQMTAPAVETLLLTSCRVPALVME